MSTVASGGVMVAGYAEYRLTTAYLTRRGMVARYGSDGTLLWERVIMPSENRADINISIFGITALGGGEHAVIGQHQHATNFGTAAWVAVFDEDGDILRQAAYQAPIGGVVLHRAVAIPGDGLLVVGAGNSPVAVRLDDDLGVRWASVQPRPAGPFLQSTATRVHRLPSGGFVVGGFHEHNTSQLDWWVGRIDDEGEGIWSRWLDTDLTYNGLSALVPWGTDEILAVGFRSPSPHGGYAIRLGTDGFVRSQHELGLPGSDVPLGGRLTADGSLVVASTETISSGDAYESPQLFRIGPDDPLASCEAAVGTAFRSAALDSASVYERPADYELSGYTIEISPDMSVASTPGPSSVTGASLCPSP